MERTRTVYNLVSKLNLNYCFFLAETAVQGNLFLAKTKNKDTLKQKIMCLFCVSGCPDNFWFWQKKKMEQNMVLTPSYFLEHVPFLKTYDLLP